MLGIGIQWSNEGMRNDICTKMMALDSIAESSFDFGMHEQWLKNHGFMQVLNMAHMEQYPNSSIYPKYVNHVFMVGGVQVGGVEIELAHSALWKGSTPHCGQLKWLCRCSNDYTGIFNSIGIWISSLCHSAFFRRMPEHSEDEFELGMPRELVIHCSLARWLKQFETQGASPEEALENFCFSVMEAFEKVKGACSKHDAKWLDGNWIGREK